MKSICVIFDTLRPDRLSAYSHHRETAPTMERLADDGVTFRNCFSQAIWTAPSSGAILSGQYPLVNDRGRVSNRAETQETLATPFRRDGVTTVSVASNPHAGKRNRLAGFDEYVDLYEEYSVTELGISKYTADAMIDWISDHADEDFFMFVWWMGTHTPFQTPDSYSPRWTTEDERQLGSKSGLQNSRYEDRETIKRLYDDTIRYNDDQFGRVIEQLEESGIYDETHLTISADHGELLDEHGRLAHLHGGLESLARWVLPTRFRTQYQLFDQSGFVGHQHLLPYDELLNVPLIQKFPDGEFAGTTVDQLAQTIDIAPTLADVADLSPLTQFQGSTLRPTITEATSVNEYVYSSSPMLHSCYRYDTVRDPDYKYVVQVRDVGENLHSMRENPLRGAFTVAASIGSPRELLLDATAGEETDVSDSEPETLQRFREEYDSWDRESQTEKSADELATQEQLQALGYVD